MLKLKRGCTVPFPEKLKEEYEVNGNWIAANINAEKFLNLLLYFINIHDEPMFFILEIPTNRQNEKLENGVYHKDVYYIDGCSREEAVAILDRVGELLTDDGLCQFGFGCHESQDEIMIGKYNIVTLLSKNTDDYRDFFQENGIFKADKIVTAWDTFSQEHFGISESCEVNGERIYDIPEIFKDWGIYFAEQREDT